MTDETQTRRRFLALLPGALLAVAASARSAGGQATRSAAAGTHPEPRKGITAARVVPREQLPDHDEVREVFDMIREIPQVADGIRCYCGCAEIPEYYSLLSCYEGDGMAQSCAICPREGRLVYKLHKQGKSLKEIRAAVDQEFG